MAGKLIVFLLAVVFLRAQDSDWNLPFQEGLRLQSTGRYAAAEAAYRLALHGAGNNTAPQTLATVLNNLGVVCRLQGKYEEAATFLKRALTLVETKVPLEHRLRAAVLNDLGRALQSSGLLAEARRLLSQALTIRERTFGAEDPDTAESLNNLGDLEEQEGHLAAAERLFLRGLKIREKVYGADDAATARTRNNLCVLYRIWSRMADALTCSAGVRATFEIALGPNHPTTLIARNTLAAANYYSGRVSEAERLWLDILRRMETESMLETSDAAVVFSNLAQMYAEQHRELEAETNWKLAISIFEKAHDPRLRAVLFEYGRLLRRTGKRSQARQIEAAAKRIVPMRDDQADLTVDINELLHAARPTKSYRKN